MRVPSVYVAAVLLIVFGIAHGVSERVVVGHAQAQRGEAPSFEVDPSWPKPLPNNWTVGMIAGIAVDSRDHVWIIHRPTGAPAGEIEGGKQVAPPVIEFDPQGNVVQAWGGPGRGSSWFETVDELYPVGTAPEHGIFVDDMDNVWLAGNGHIVLKFTREGKLLMQIGQLWQTAGSNDTRLLGNPTDVAVDPKTNEVFIADGYVNRRIVVFDSDTGAYKRHWGAYGLRPEDGPIEIYDPDGPLPRQFYQLHGVGLARDGLVYASDRQRNRVQVFRTDGTFVNEVVIPTDTVPIQTQGTGVAGSTWRTGFSADPEQRFLYIADMANSKVWILNRGDLQILGSFDSPRAHHMAGADSKGNLYTTGGRSPQKFLLKGGPAASTTGR